MDLIVEKEKRDEWMEFWRREMVMRDLSIEKGKGDEWMVV